MTTLSEHSPAPAKAAGGAVAGSQTLSRGGPAPEIPADAASPLTIAELADSLEVHRSVAYRILRTLEEHGLVVRGGSGKIELGPRLAALARDVSRDLQSAALPELTAVANELSMTAFLSILDRGEVVTLVSVEPRHSLATVVHRPGTLHTLDRGAPGHAIQLALSSREAEELGVGLKSPDEIAAARALGYTTSHDEVIAGISSVAVPLRLNGFSPASVAVVYVGRPHETPHIASRLAEAAEAIRSELG